MAFPKNWETVVSKLIAKAWLNDDFHKRFFSDPAVVLREAGLMLEEFVEVKVIQNLTGGSVLRMAGAEGGTVVYEIPLPSKPADLSDEHISSWVKGKADLLHAIPECC